MNPLLKFKEDMDYTYDELAETMQVSRSVIQRTIEGAYIEMPPTVLRTLSYITGHSEITLAREYQKDSLQDLLKVNLPAALEPDKDSTVDDFDIWCAIMLRMNGVNFVGNPPHLAVARVLKVNVATVQQFYRGTTAHMPNTILKRIKLIRTLQEEHHDDSV